MYSSMHNSMSSSMHSSMHSSINKNMHNMPDGTSERPRTKAVEDGWSAETCECRTVEHRSG